MTMKIPTCEMMELLRAVAGSDETWHSMHRRNDLHSNLNLSFAVKRRPKM
jgi:hypothetical protein